MISLSNNHENSDKNDWKSRRQKLNSPNLRSKKRLVWAIFLTFNLLLGGCHQPINNHQKTSDMTKKIGVFLYRFDDHFISAVKGQMAETIDAIRIGENEEISYTFFDGKNQKEIQFSQISEAITEGYDALAINIVDRSDASRIIELARKADIPIVFFNRQPVDVDMARWGRLYYVGLNGVDSGTMQGDIVSSYWKNHSEADRNQDGVMQYVLLQGQFNHQDTILRSKYSIQAIEDNGIKVQELAKDTANWQRTEADDKMQEWLAIYQERIEMVIANNDMMALGALDAMRRRQMTEMIPIVGFDGIRPALEALQANQLVGTVQNDDAKQGEIVMRIAYYLASDKDPTDYLPDIENGTYYWVPYVAYKKK